MNFLLPTPKLPNTDPMLFIISNQNRSVYYFKICRNLFVYYLYRFRIHDSSWLYKY